ncbi:glycoside hydrolase family 43 protein [Prolixibacteraceae bacterium Z1-6]|uniref:Glycoside hydrolase family 43 protein n=1 Tax=Draconibacterium aestuarii TaxID=2998507 RepID=A0A9X3F7G7_9BACT|nr:glycoside hydrolase family 43 protein [Prolixibacteraceae bacterium Z1-6]
MSRFFKGMKLRILVVLFLCSWSMANCSTPDDGSIPDEVKTTFQNPLWDGADPWLVKQGDEYIYCYSANNGIVLSRSKFMTKQGELKQIWRAPETGWNKACIWAPEIHFIDGHWYVYYAAGQSGPPFIHQRTGVLRSKSDDVFSEYEDMGILNTGDVSDDLSKNIWAIDMTVFQHNNKLYAVWSGWLEQKDTDASAQHLFIQEMENPYTLKGNRVLLSSPEENWETGGPLNLNEGPEVLQNGDHVFIVYSCRESWLKEYRQGMLQLNSPDADPLNPDNWTKKGPVFEGNSTVYGVGHCSFVKSPDNTEDWIIYHSKKTTEPGWDRNVRMQPFEWNPDGSPDFGQAIPAGKVINRPSGEVEIEENQTTQ